MKLVYKKGINVVKKIALEFNLDEDKVLKLWKQLIESNKNSIENEKFGCIHILIGGPNAGHKCGKRTAEENGLCTKHKPKDKDPKDEKPKCLYVFTEGKNKGNNCSKSQCADSKKGFCSAHNKKFETNVEEKKVDEEKVQLEEESKKEVKKETKKEEVKEIEVAKEETEATKTGRKKLATKK
jgi:hypothetical protein